MRDLKALSTRYRVHAECIAASVFALAVFVMLGVSARRKLAAARADQASVSLAEREISTFKAAFKTTDAERERRMTLPDSLAVAVLRDERLPLVGALARHAELAGLSSVRVNFAPPDSAAAPGHPNFFATPVTVADYGIAVECAGDFASLLSFIDQLPPSVALQRITAVRSKSGAHFRVMLAVFEAARPVQHG